MDYRKKYLKYKNKYLELQSQSGGANPYQPSDQYWQQDLYNKISHIVYSLPNPKGKNDRSLHIIMRTIYDHLREMIQRQGQVHSNEIDKHLVNNFDAFNLGQYISSYANSFMYI